MKLKERTNHRSVQALLARGFDSDLALTLVHDGYTLGQIKLKSKDELRALGIHDDQIDALHNEARPAIPSSTLIQVLFASRWTCCLCRNSEKAIVVHHIQSWATSRSHAEENLAVLCLDCHGKAHTTSDLAQNLTPARLKESRDKWLKKVHELDTRAALEETTLLRGFATWDYFNHFRLLELATQSNIDVAAMVTKLNLVEQGLTTTDGTPIELPAQSNHQSARFMYDMGTGLRARYWPLYKLYVELIHSILMENQWVDLRANWTPSRMSALVRPGTIFVLKGAHYFKVPPNAQTGLERMREGYRRADGIRLSFTFNAWEITSSSAYSQHLSGRSVVTSVGLIRDVERKKSGKLDITARCLAIGSGFGPDNGTRIKYDVESMDLEEE